MGSYNPDSPYVMGMQWPALVAQAVNLDTSSEVGYTFPALASSSTIDRARVLTTTPPTGQPSRKELLVNVYPRDQVAATGPIRRLTAACTTGSLGTGATLQGGAATVQAAVANPSDAGYVQLSGASAFCRFWFDTSGFLIQSALLNRRILDVSVLYSASGPFTSLSPALTLSLERPSATVVWDMDNTLDGPAAQTSNIAPFVSRLGELNPFPLSTTTPNVSTERRPWRYGAGINNYVGIEQLNATGGTNINVRITSSSAAAGLLFQLHYLALLITYCEENRIGAGGLDISAGAVATNGIFQYEIPLGQIEPSYGADTSITVGELYAVTIGQSYSGVISTANAVPVAVNTAGSIDTFPTHRGVLLRKTLRAGSMPTEETTDDLPSVTLYTGAIAAGTVITSSHSYVTQTVMPVTTFTDLGDDVQYLLDDHAATYVWVIFYARRSPGTLGSLTVQQVTAGNVALGPTASISVADFDELDDLINGWARVQLRLSQSVTTTGGGGVTYWAFTADTAVPEPWQVLGAVVNPRYTLTESANLTGYGAETAFAVNTALANLAQDMAVSIAQEMDAVTGLAVATAVQALSVLDECCAVAQEHIPTGIYYHTLSWTEINSAVVAGWAYYEIQRQDDTMGADEWETIAQITAPNVAGCADYEARIGVASRYRIRMVHRSGVAGPWSASVASTIAAPGVTGTSVDRSVLVFTSNDNPGGNLAYVMDWAAGQAQEDFTFFEGSETDLQTQYRRDFQVAFRPTERGGVQFVRTLLINAACIPTSTMDKGFTGLRDLAWDTIPYVNVRDELANRWLSTLQLPAGSVRRIDNGHLEFAVLTITEVTQTPAPLDVAPDCEGLAASDMAMNNYARAPLPAAITGTTTITDTFTRTVANGWGTADTGQAWSTIGTATDYAVAAGVGTHSLGTRNVARITYFNTPTFLNCQSTVRMFPAVVSTGAPGRAAVLLRDDGTGANHYRVELVLGLAGALSVRIVRRVAGVDTQLATAAVSGTYIANQQIHITGRIRGNFIEGKAWRDADAEPTSFQVSASDNTFTAAGRTGAWSFLDNTNTNTLPVAYSYDNWATISYWADLDVRVQMRPTADAMLWNVEQQNTATFAGWFTAQDFGSTEIDVFNGGFFQAIQSTASMLVVQNQLRWVRMTYESNIGSGNARARFYTSLDGSSWTLINTVTATAEPLDVGAGIWEVAVTQGVTIVQMQILSGVAGTTVASPNFGAQPAGTTSFTDAQGNLWTIGGEALCGETS